MAIPFATQCSASGKIDKQLRFDAATLPQKLLALSGAMKRYAPFIIVVLVGLATAVAGTILYRAKRVPSVMLEAPGAEQTPNKWLHVRGKPDAPVTLEEYGDFQCPPCGMLSEPLNKLEEDYRGRLRLIFHHLPLKNHQHARAAALAAEAAALQGKFWEMHDILYREQQVWSKAADVAPLFSSYAGVVGLDVERFKKDAAGSEVALRVDADLRRAETLKISTTPTIFINKQLVPPSSLNPQALRTEIDTALQNRATK